MGTYNRFSFEREFRPRKVEPWTKKTSSRFKVFFRFKLLFISLFPGLFQVLIQVTFYKFRMVPGFGFKALF